MRLRLWRRRWLTRRVPMPRRALRRAIAWPLRWLAGAVVLGLSAALALWAFEVGRDIAGLDGQGEQALSQLREQVSRLNRDLAQAQAVVHTAESALTTERTAQQALATQLEELQSDNRNLRRELAFYEQLTPSSGQDGLAVRGLQARRSSGAVQWQLLLVQSGGREVAELKGQLEVTYAGLQDGQPWAMTEPGTRRPLLMRQSLRLDGTATVPTDVVLKTVTIRVMQGATTLLTQATPVTADTSLP